MKRLLLLSTLVLVALSGPHPAHGQAPVEAWARRYSAPAVSVHQVTKTVVDSSGNAIVAGNITPGTTGGDWLIIKYSGAGVPLWTNRYDGAANSDDVTSAMAVDGSGNVFVTGQSGSDNATIAYSGAGVPLWTNHFAGAASAIATDGSGNVIVTGNSRNTNAPPFNYDYATIKYSGAGVPLWTNRYRGPANYNYATALAVDGSGNVIVTGNSASANEYPFDSDYATIKYSGAGMPLWTNRYNGPANKEDSATAVAVDSSGNVFVTGGAVTWYWNGTEDVFHSDYTTIAYSGTGAELWKREYNGPDSGQDYAIAVAVDTSGNVVVTGTSAVGNNGDSYDYATIKYSGTGVTLWLNRYDGGPGNGINSANAMAVDGNGNVFVTGHSLGNDSHYDFATVKYSSSGLTLWTNRYNEPGDSYASAKAAAIDSSGNVVVAGDLRNLGNSDFSTIKYSGAGALLWTNRYNSGTGGNSPDQAAAVAVDSGGNVYVSGYSYGIGTSADYVTVAYSGSGAGVPLWTNRYNGPDNGTEVVTAMAVGSNGNVFVTGWSSTVLLSDYDYATVAYSGAGVPLWTNRYSGPGNNDDQPSALAVDAGGNVFVTGYSVGNNGYRDYATIKYSGAGVPLWTNRYNGPANDRDDARALAVDGSGNVIVTGLSFGNGSYDYATIKYSGAGVALWTNRYNGPANGDDYATALALDGGGNVFVTGSSAVTVYCDEEGCIYGFDYATIKYSSAGVPLWTNYYNGPGNGDDGAVAVAVDGTGSVLVTGDAFSGSSLDYATIKYSGAGVPLWTNRYNGPGNDHDSATAVAVDGSGKVFVTGSSASTNTVNAYNFDYATIAYSPGGVPLWTNRYNGPANGDDSPGGKQSLALSPDGSVYVTGGFDGDYTTYYTTYDFATVKYAVLLPLLTISSTTTNTVAISWPSPSTGFTLQQNTNNVSSVNWSNVLTTPTDNGTTKTVIVNLPTGNRFYRLKYP